MATTATAPSAVRYAPEDHSLPKPWKGLVDERTGYLYFWNPDTNVTQYERPTPPKFPSVSASSSVQVSSLPNGGYAPAKDDDNYTRPTERARASEPAPKNDSGSRFTEVLT